VNILITGGTGFIGKSLCDRLIAENHEVYAITRNLDRAIMIMHHKVQCSENLYEFSDIKFHAIINLAGEPIADKRWTRKRKHRLYASRVEYTQQLIDFLKETEQTPKIFLSGSAVGYYGSHDAKTILDEESYYADGFTHDLCADWEAKARQLASNKTRVCLLRTGIVLEKHGGALGKMLLPFKLGLGGPIGDGEQIMSWIHLQDWINAAMFVLKHDEISGPVNFVSPNPVNNKKFTASLATTLNRPAFFRVPCSALRLAMGEAAELLCEGQQVIPKKLIEAGFQYKFPDIDSAFADILTNHQLEINHNYS
jgi:uncharacterized protein (TIGR01777 family)